MKYRIYFEPIDIDAEDPHDAVNRLDDMVNKNCYIINPSKILPINKDGFPIRQ